LYVSKINFTFGENCIRKILGVPSKVMHTLKIILSRSTLMLTEMLFSQAVINIVLINQYTNVPYILKLYSTVW